MYKTIKKKDWIELFQFNFLYVTVQFYCEFLIDHNGSK